MLLDTASGTPNGDVGNGLGASLGFYALNEGLTVNTSLLAKGGHITLSGAQGVAVNDGVLDVSGVAMDFGRGKAYAPAGSIKIDAGQGDLRLALESTMDLSAVGADAGSLDLRATSVGAAVVLDGILKGQSIAGVGNGMVQNPLQGSFALDAGRSPDQFDALNDKLNTSGFTQSRTVRVRNGDLTVGAGSTVTAHAIALSTDDGNLTVAGTLDASGPSGGSIDLYASSAGGQDTGKLALIGATLLAVVPAAEYCMQGGLPHIRSTCPGIMAGVRSKTSQHMSGSKSALISTEVTSQP
jgi:hypothetical protein